jgi:taurine dioxygenase
MTQLNLTPLGPFAMEALGVDLSIEVDPDTIARLRQAWCEHGLLVFRDQQLEETDLVRFSRYFGELEIHVRKEYLSPAHPEVLLISNIRDGERSIGILGDHEVGWHHDQIYLPQPALGSLLYGVELPASGGNTAFANLAMAYEAMPQERRQRLQALRGIQSYAYFNGTWSEPTSAEQSRRTPDISHPLVRTHPESGRKAIYADPGMTRAVEGLSEAASRSLLGELFAWCTRDEFVYEHRWRRGDVLMWDNACTMHRRGEFDPSSRRLMKRTTILAPSDRGVPY